MLSLNSTLVLGFLFVIPSNLTPAALGKTHTLIECALLVFRLSRAETCLVGMLHSTQRSFNLHLD